MRIGDETVAVDTTRFADLGPNERAVRVHLSGKITVGAVRYRDGGFKKLGRREAVEEWILAVQGRPGFYAGGRVADYVTVLGAVVEKPRAPTLTNIIAAK